MEPGITIGFLNRLLVAEGLSLGVVPEVFIIMMMMTMMIDDDDDDDDLR